MTDPSPDPIATAAEAMEADALPRMREVHTDPGRDKGSELPAAMKEPAKRKSPAQWAYERLILYIKKFEETLDAEHEVGLGLVGGDAGVMRIEGLGYFDPDIVTYYGSTPDGAKTQLIQHVTQLNVMLRAAPKQAARAEPRRIGFALARELDRDEDPPKA